jgi:heme/copper-type cytochrome/quinol oxidase subunit 2
VSADHAPSPAPWKRTGAGRLVLVGTCIIAWGSFISGVGSGEPLSGVVPAIISVAIGVTAWRWGGFATLPALLVGAAVVMVGLIDLSITLSAPDVYGDFVLAVSMLIGGAITLAGALVAVGRRIANRPSREGRPTRWLGMAAAAAVGILSIVAFVAALTSSSSVPASERRGAITVEMPDDSYSVRRIEATVGEPVKVFLRNTDHGKHTFTIDEFDFEEVLGAQRDALLTFTPTRTGRFEYYCRVSGHGDQTGTLAVTA